MSAGARALRFVATGSGDVHLSGDWSAARARDAALAWDFADVKQMHRRRYLMAHTALEIYSSGGESLLLNFASKRLRSRARAELKRKCDLEYRDRDRRRPAFQKMLGELTDAWVRRDVCNFDYLMRLNELAGRTYNDLNQYPIFPWVRRSRRDRGEVAARLRALRRSHERRITTLQVLADYTSTRLNLADPAVFRDLSRPMGAQDAHQRELVAQAAKRRARPAAICRRAPRRLRDPHRF